MHWAETVATSVGDEVSGVDDDASLSSSAGAVAGLLSLVSSVGVASKDGDEDVVLVGSSSSPSLLEDSTGIQLGLFAFDGAGVAVVIVLDCVGLVVEDIVGRDVILVVGGSSSPSTMGIALVGTAVLTTATGGGIDDGAVVGSFVIEFSSSFAC